MTSILFLKIRVVIPSQQVNACLPIFMTDCGMVDIETLLQSQKPTLLFLLNYLVRKLKVNFCPY